LTTDKSPAATFTRQAFPALLGSASAIIPVRVFWPAPAASIDNAPATMTETLPALPDADVPLATCPLLMILRFPAVTATFPAVPVPRVLEAMLVSAEVPAVDVPSTDKFPAACTEMFPALPDQNVPLWIAPPAATLTSPAAIAISAAAAVAVFKLREVIAVKV
jgi:hypothetical protein